MPDENTTRLICCDLLNIEETLLFLLDSCKIKKKLELITIIIWSLIKFEQFDVNCFGK